LLFLFLVSRHEKNISAQHPQAHAHAWIQSPYGYPQRPQSDQCPSCQRSRPTDPLIKPQLQDEQVGFPKSWRLLTADAYSGVFNGPRKSVDRFFTVLWISNGLCRGRLGMAVAKKNLKRAIDRNLVKRVIRESFRHRRRELSGADIVVLSRRGLRADDRKRLRAAMDRHWDRVARELSSEKGKDR